MVLIKSTDVDIKSRCRKDEDISGMGDSIPMVLDFAFVSEIFCFLMK